MKPIQSGLMQRDQKLPPHSGATVYTRVDPILPNPPTLREAVSVYKKEGAKPNDFKASLFKGDGGGSNPHLSVNSEMCVHSSLSREMPQAGRSSQTAFTVQIGITIA